MYLFIYLSVGLIAGLHEQVEIWGKAPWRRESARRRKSDWGGKFKGLKFSPPRSKVTNSEALAYAERIIDLWWVNIRTCNFLLVDQSSPNFLPNPPKPAVDQICFQFSIS